ncbi:MAG: SGNH/GDSL hydrolase family protein [Bacteroidales bacterium]|nr:SGNH/GDSL hydrolase family protein [Bacteroidales bacterium]
MKNLIFLPALILFLMYSCQNKGEVSEAPLAFRFLALGDSYTIGEGVGMEETFPAQLALTLEAGSQFQIETNILAKTGWTTSQLINAIADSIPEGTFDLVTLLIGVNNQYRGLDKTQYRLEFRELLQQAVVFAGHNAKRVIVLSIPDYGVTPFAANLNPQKISEEINIFNAINFDESGRTEAHYIEITSISRKASSDKTLLAGDSLHPSGKMYREWVSKMHPILESIVNLKKSTE